MTQSLLQIIVAFIFLIVSADYGYKHPDDSIYAVRACESETSVIQIDITTGQSKSVYSPPDGLEVFDIMTTNNPATFCARMDETTSPSKFRIELKGGEEEMTACQHHPNPIQKCNPK